MKYDALQESFLSGEISPRAQGHVNSEMYKAAVGSARNALPTQTGSIASRSGALNITDSQQSSPFGTKAVCFNVENSPWGDVEFIISDAGAGPRLRVYTRYGPVSLAGWQDLGDFFKANASNTGALWTDPVRREIIYDGGNADLTPLTLTVTQNKFLGAPAKADLHFYTSGSGININFYTGAVLTSQVAAVSGYNKIEFQPSVITSIQFVPVAGADGATLWGVGLAGKQSGQPTPTYEVDVTGVSISTAMRHAVAWDTVNGVFYAVFVGPGMIPMRVTFTPVSGSAYTATATTDFFWGAFGLGGSFPSTTAPLWRSAGAVISVLAYQNRWWFGLDDKYGTIIATRIGWFDRDAVQNQTNATGPAAVPGDRFVVSAGHIIQYVIPAGAMSFAVRLGVANEGSDKDVFTINGIAGDLSYLRILVQGDATNPGDFKVAIRGGVYGSDPSWVTITINSAPPAVDTAVIIQRTSAAATDPLDLKIAQPTGAVSWMAELRGLLLGTTRGEQVATSSTLAVDPATGQTIEIVRHSSHGSDPLVPALPVLDKVLFVPRGRRRIRMVGENISTYGGLVAPDISTLGEHLLKKRIRSMAYLRSPVSRLVLGFDDGTGAIALVNEDSKVLAWSQFSLPPPYDIYSVNGLDTEYGAQLWIGTSKGHVLVIPDIDSDVPSRTRHVLVNGFDTVQTLKDPTLPILDGWVRLPTEPGVGTVYNLLPVEWVGQQVYLLVNGVVQGPYTAAAGATVTVEAAIPTSYVDGNGITQQTVIYAGLKLPSNGFTTLPQEGGNPRGSAQGYKSRAVQLYVRLVDSYIPLINGVRGVPERDGADLADAQAARITEDVRATQLGWERARTLDVEMDLPLRFEVSAIFGGTGVSST